MNFADGLSEDSFTDQQGALPANLCVAAAVLADFQGTPPGQGWSISRCMAHGVPAKGREQENPPSETGGRVSCRAKSLLVGPTGIEPMTSTV